MCEDRRDVDETSEAERPLEASRRVVLVACLDLKDLFDCLKLEARWWCGIVNVGLSAVDTGSSDTFYLSGVVVYLSKGYASGVREVMLMMRRSEVDKAVRVSFLLGLLAKAAKKVSNSQKGKKHAAEAPHKNFEFCIFSTRRFYFRLPSLSKLAGFGFAVHTRSKYQR